MYRKAAVDDAPVRRLQQPARNQPAFKYLNRQRQPGKNLNVAFDLPTRSA